MKTRLPVFGVGPIYVISCMLLTICGLVLKKMGMLVSGDILNLRFELMITGVVLIIAGCGMWIYAVLIQKISVEIKKGQLVTSGIYSMVRNPIYSAFLLIFSGVLISAHNIYLLILPVLFYLFLTILLKQTEEKWLLEKFGNTYIEYCKKVNRVIPWWRY